DRRAMPPREALRERIRLGVAQEVHAALAIQRHVFMAMPGYRLEAQRPEYLAQRGRVRRRVLDDFEPGGSHRVVPGLESGAHGGAPCLVFHVTRKFKSRTEIVGSLGQQVIANLP